ncbi:hypothetical protein Droror1_Dr00000377 [Drosera rotundifolia]
MPEKQSRAGGEKPIIRPRRHTNPKHPIRPKTTISHTNPFNLSILAEPLSQSNTIPPSAAFFDPVHRRLDITPIGHNTTEPKTTPNTNQTPPPNRRTTTNHPSHQRSSIITTRKGGQRGEEKRRDRGERHRLEAVRSPFPFSNHTASLHCPHRRHLALLISILHLASPHVPLPYAAPNPSHKPCSPHRRAATPPPDPSLDASASPAAATPLHRRCLNPLLDLVFYVQRKGPALRGEALGTTVAVQPEMPRSGGGSVIRRWWLSGVRCDFGFGGVMPDWGSVKPSTRRDEAAEISPGGGSVANKSKCFFVFFCMDYDISSSRLIFVVENLADLRLRLMEIFGIGKSLMLILRFG